MSSFSPELSSGQRAFCGATLGRQQARDHLETDEALYGLDYASRKFWLRVKDVFLNKIGLKTDEAFYFRKINGKFYGAVLTHVNDFEVAGTSEFVREIISTVEN